MSFLPIGAISPVLLSYAEPVQATTITPPNASDVTRFEAILESPNAIDEVTTSKISALVSHFGERIEHFASSSNDALSKAHQVLTATQGDFSPTEGLKLTMGLIEAGFYYDLIGKGISRATQNIDQLTRLQ